MMEHNGRIIIGGTNSGCGKTTITCALLGALKNRGLNVKAAKCGPDYIDPMFHELALKIPSKNIDLFLCGGNTGLLAKHCRGADICIAEGVMGYYDGLDMGTDCASTYDIAMTTKTPAVIAINAKGSAMTICALIKGMKDFRKETMIRGVILNNISGSVYDSLRPVIEKETGLKAVGYLPYDNDFSIKSRRLGLAPDKNMADKLEKLAETAEKTIDMDMLMSIAETAEELPQTLPKLPYVGRAKIFIARDEAFCFYYRDNLELLEKLGAEVGFFSPLKDKEIPQNADGIILGGGYPELYAKELSENKSMLASIRERIEDKMPCLAECGGFMYLNKSIGKIPMAGIFGENACDTGKLSNFGYVELKSENDTLNGMRGHEFHYWTTGNNGCECMAVKPSGKKSWPCMRIYKNTTAGFPHLYYYSKPAFAADFIERCLR